MNAKQVSHIIEGNVNKALDSVGLLSEDTRMLGEQRFDNCMHCDDRPHPGNKNINGPGMTVDNRCKVCGCDMTKKTLVIGATCPIGRW